MTMTLIETVTVGSGGASAIEFTSIPQTYTDLQIVFSGRSTRNTATYFTNGKLGINGLTSGYTLRDLVGQSDSGTFLVESRTALTDSLWGFNFPSATNTASTFSNASFYFPNYAGSTAKSMSADYVSENNANSTFSWVNGIFAGLNTTTSAITSIQIGIRGADSATLVEYSSASLYGILKGSGGATVS